MENIVECVHCKSKNVVGCDYNNDYVSFECRDCEKYFTIKDNNNWTYNTR